MEAVGCIIKYQQEPQGRSWSARGRNKNLNRAIAWLLAVVVSLFLPALCQVQTPGTYTITTVAGTGTAGSDGDGHAAAAAQLNYPFGLALDSSGNLYIADQLNHKIRKLATDGTISTVAGTGTAGFSGENGKATSANLYLPCGVAVDQAGNLFIAATGNNAIRKVATDGTITTVAGTGSTGSFGDDGLAISAFLNTPVSVAVDNAGYLYIADTGNNRVRKVSPTDGMITAFAGNGTAGALGDGGDAKLAKLNRPEGVVLDASGNLYIADTSNHRVRKVTTDGTITTVAGNGVYGDSGDGGQATQASLRYPKSIALDSAGRLYILDAYSGRIRLVGTDGIISTIAGSGVLGFGGDGGAASHALFTFPSGMVREASGRIYVADTANSRIRLLTPDTPSGAHAGLPTIVAGSVISASAFGAFTSIAPGSWIEIHGSNLASSPREWTMADFSGLTAPTELDGTKVTIGGQAVFLSFVGPDQVNAQVPSGIKPGLRELTVTTPAGTSAPYTIAVNPTQAGLFAPASFRISGNQYVAAVSGDGTAFIGPSGAVEGFTTRPAQPGEIITIYAVGGGPVAPDTKAGDFVEELTSLSSQVEISFDQTPAPIVWAGLAPGSIGLYQFNVVVPDVDDGEAVPLRIKLGGVGGGQTLNIAVKR
jgi:uncharacterized protein (TIGR03437 family)